MNEAGPSDGSDAGGIHPRFFFTISAIRAHKEVRSMLFTVVSFIAATLTTASFVPQAVKTIRTRDTSSISLGMYLLFTAGVILWMVYGIATSQASIIISNAITACLALVILSFKIAGLRSGPDNSRGDK
jgi:MtN3 and saliva related transmembrane protein